MEVAAQMRPAGGLAELATAISTLFIEFVEPSIGVRLQDTASTLQVLSDMSSLPVRSKVVNRSGWCGPRP